ncbi:hypothetical protein [Kribbella sp. NPDC050459]|uniref:hypothetical protein n=1 Tax=Kribbella sp. NPDC050459 TaxID=3155785 RepID=UPI0033EF8349
MLLVGFAMTSASTAPADAQPDSLLADVVVIGVPGLRWSDVAASPELTALVGQANAGSISVRTAGPRTCPIDGWLTISAGTRARVSESVGECPALPAVNGTVANWQFYLDQQHKYHTDAEPGRLGALGKELCGFGPGGAVATAGKDGSVSKWWPHFDPAVLAKCNDAVVDAGALPTGAGRADAVKMVAELVTQARDQGRWVVLAGVAEEAPGARREALVAMQLSPDNGPRWLTSNSTRRPGLIQLTDLTATLLSDSAPGAPIDGAEIHSTGPLHTDAAAVIENRLDAKERFEQPRHVVLPVVLTLVAVQLLALGWYLLRHSRASRRTAVVTLLAMGGFFSAVFLSTATEWWRWPRPGVSLYVVTLGISALIGIAAYAILRRNAAVGVAAVAYLVLLVDGVLGTPMQLGSMFTQGPVVGGRFYGFGNSTFPTLAVATLVLAGAAGNRLVPRSRSYAALAVLLIGGVAIIVDGMPGWGTDFGGVIALTPAVLLLAWYTWRSRVTLRTVLGLGLTGFAAVAVLAIADYQRAPQNRTHFGTFVARLLDGDVTDVLIRKLELSLGYLDNPGGWVLLVTVLAAFAAALWPQRVPSVAYRQWVNASPLNHPVLLALALCGLVAMLLNDFGVLLPAIMIGFVLPLLVAQLVDQTRDRSTHQSTPRG